MFETFVQQVAFEIDYLPYDTTIVIFSVKLTDNSILGS